MAKQYDLIIIGGGLVGTSLLCALRHSGLKVALVEANWHKPTQKDILDQRSLVLSLGSKLYFEELGVWNKLQYHSRALDTIKISEQGCFSKLFLDKESFFVDALGYVINIDILNQLLWDEVKQSADNIDVYCPYKLINIEDSNSITINISGEGNDLKLTSKVLLAADGVRSYVRNLLNIECDKYDYKQIALIANVEHELDNQGIAYERFSPQGPFAILPRVDTKISGVVWPWPLEQQEYIKNLPDEDLIQKLQQLFGYKLGKFKKIGVRQYFPLMRILSKDLTKDRVLFIGNSANNIHPIGGQGFNLGLRDVKNISNLLVSNNKLSKDCDFSDKDVNALFEEYKVLRINDHQSLADSTHAIVKLFENNSNVVKMARNIGMTVANHSLLLRTLIADRSMGLNVA